MARSAEGLPTKPRSADGIPKPKPKAKKKLRYPNKGPRPGNHKGGAPKGNQFWRLALNGVGTEKKYTPIQLLEKAQEYFDWCDANPWRKHLGGNRYQNLGRPYTNGGFCLFAGITEQTFINYSEGVGYQEYFETSKAIREAIRNQKFEGAAVGQFNAAIIARDLGLVDRQERDIGNKNNEPFKTVGVTAEITPDMNEKDASQLYRSMMNPPKPEA